VTDIQAFLVATRQWLEQVEFAWDTPGPAAPEQEFETLDAIAGASFRLQRPA